MIVILAVILWLIFGMMVVTSIFYAEYRQHKILGTSFSREHAMQTETKAIIRGFKKKCYGIFVGSILVSLILFVPDLEKNAEFLMLILLFGNMFINMFIINHDQNKLVKLKQEKGWVYQKKTIVKVDLSVSRARGSFRTSTVWVWMFMILSFVPTVLLFIDTRMQDRYPLIFSLMGPLCQAIMLVIYYKMRDIHSGVIHSDTQDNMEYARQEERINSITSTMMALIMLIFWISFSLVIMYTKSDVWILLPVIFLIIALLLDAFWQQKKMKALEEAFYGKSTEEDEVQEQEGSWKWGIYYNPSDPRLFVPKRISSMGWTVNVARPAGKMLFGVIGLIIAVSFALLFYSSSYDYKVQIQGDEITIDAAMYDRQYEESQIDSVSIVTQLPYGTRTNGYGGVQKSFGHFLYDDYGNCMVYIYNNVDCYVLLKMKGNDPSYVIINAQTVEQTEALYDSINQWIAQY